METTYHPIHDSSENQKTPLLSVEQDVEEPHRARAENTISDRQGEITNAMESSPTLLDLDRQLETANEAPPHWEIFDNQQNIENCLDQLGEMGFPEESLTRMRETLMEAKSFLQSQSSSTENKKLEPASQEPIQQKEKPNFTFKQAAAIGLLMLLDGAINGGRGTVYLLEEVMSHYIKHKAMPEFMGKLGFDENTIKELTENRRSLGRGLLHEKIGRSDLIRFVSNLSSVDAYDFLDSLDDEERKLLVEEGSFGNRHNMLSKDEIQKHLLEKLSEKQLIQLKLVAH